MAHRIFATYAPSGRLCAIAAWLIAASFTLADAAAEPAQSALKDVIELARPKLFGTPGGCNGDVFASAISDSGLIYLGGVFTNCEDVAAANVVSYDPASKQFRALTDATGSGTNGPVYALHLVGSDLYVGGNYFLAGGIAANSIARWDGSGWHAMGPHGQTGMDSLVFALTSRDNQLYAGGYFTVAGGQSANKIARWDGSVWSNLSEGTSNGITSPPVNENPSGVFALAFFGDQLYVGGVFTEVVGRPANNIARWSGSAWTTVGGEPGLGVDDEVLAMSANGSALYVGGEFRQAGGQTANHIAAWNGSAWQGLADGTDAPVRTVATVGDEVLVGGDFQQAGGLPANHVARWDGSSWSGLGVGQSNGVSATVQTVFVSAPKIYVAGRFTSAGNLLASHAAVFEAGLWTALGTGRGEGVNGEVFAVAVLGGELYVGGDFDQAGGMPANHIARWNGSAWAPLGTGPSNGVDARVNALAVIGSELFVGGNFRLAGGQPANFIARWDGASWSALGADAANGTNNRVLALAVQQGQLLAGGDFTQAGGASANYIASWNGSQWSSVGSGANNGVGAAVYSIAADQGTLFVGGEFNNAGTVMANFIASWDGASWASLGSGAGNGTSSRVRALAPSNAGLYVGGEFIAAGGSRAASVALWTGTQWLPLSDSVGNGVGSTVHALAILDEQLYVGGEFAVAADKLANGLARWDGENWTGLALDSPAQQVFALGSDGISVFAGGNGLTQTPLPVLQTTGPSGEPANGPSAQGAVSGDGRWIAFSTSASNLTAGSVNDGLSDVFLRDAISGQIVQISSDSLANKGMGEESFSAPALSASGETVGFAGSSGQVYSSFGGLARTASSSRGGEPGDGMSTAPSVAGDGGSVVFQTAATNLLDGVDGNGTVEDIVRKDLGSGGVTLITQSPGGEPANGPSFDPSSSADGQIVAFSTLATNLSSESVNRSESGKMGSIRQAMVGHGQGLGRSGTYVSRNLQSNVLGNGDSSSPRMTPDGRFGVFESSASNLVSGDTNGSSDIFYFELNNRQAVRLERVSVSRYGLQANGASRNPSISDDGTLISFETDANNLIELDQNDATDILVRSVATGDVLRLSRTVDNQQPNGSSVDPRLSGDGTTVVFGSAASNLSDNDSNDLSDVFASELRQTGQARATGVTNYSYTYWNPSEPGWGYNLQHQGNLLYGTWYTYAEDGAVMFLTVEAILQADGSFSGPIYRVAGTPFELINNAQAFTSITQVGEGAMVFLAEGKLQFSYDINGVAQVRALERFTFSDSPPVCVGTLESRNGTGNYSDLWWNSAEPGWGLTLAHQGDVIFLLWYTYGVGGRDQWISASMLIRQADGSYRGDLQRPDSGTPLLEINGPATSFPVPAVGDASLRFNNGETGVFTYTLDGISQSKPIERFVVVAADQPLPLCSP